MHSWVTSCPALLFATNLTTTFVLNAMSVAMVTTGTARRSDSVRRCARIAYVRASRSWADSCQQSSTTRKAIKRYWYCTGGVLLSRRDLRVDSNVSTQNYCIGNAVMVILSKNRFCITFTHHKSNRLQHYGVYLCYDFTPCSRVNTSMCVLHVYAMNHLKSTCLFCVYSTPSDVGVDFGESGRVHRTSQVQWCAVVVNDVDVTERRWRQWVVDYFVVACDWYLLLDSTKFCSNHLDVHFYLLAPP